MDIITENLLNQFSGEHGIAALSESKRFEHFSAFLMVNQLLSISFDTAEVVVGDDKEKGSGTDTGIDGIAILVEDKLVTDVEEFNELASESPSLDVEFIFVQSETSAGFDAAKIGSFAFGVSDFFRDVPQIPRNAHVAKAAALRKAIYEHSSQFKKGNPRCKMFYVTTGKVLPDVNLDARASSAESDLYNLGQFESVSFTRIGANDLQKLYRRTRTAATAEFNFVNKLTVTEQIEGVAQAYSGIIPWSEFSKIITNESGVLQRGLFVDNVRDFQDYNGVNTEIKESLRSTVKNRFILMNNGITIIARKIQPTGIKFVLEDYQIVNGCQTSNVLYDNRDVLDDTVLIPIRLIGTENEVVTNAIIRATNRQTEVREEQFFALEDYAKKLEEFFKAYPPASRIYFERRSRQYEALAIEKVRVIVFPNMVRAFAGMFLNEPHRTTRNYAGLKKKVGGEIFGKDHRMEPYYVSAFALYRLEYMFRNSKLDAKFKAARFQILMAVRLLAAGYDMPDMKANKMEAYCKTIADALQDAQRAEELILLAATFIEEASSGNFDSDTIRTEPFTQKVIGLCEAEFKKGKIAA